MVPYDAACWSLVTRQGAYDSIDLSDNALKKVDNFPVMVDLRTLLLNNNLITHVDSNIGQHLKRLDCLVLTNNRISSLAEVDCISSIKTLHIRYTILTVFVCVARRVFVARVGCVVASLCVFSPSMPACQLP
jgi:hypothetical protein